VQEENDGISGWEGMSVKGIVSQFSLFFFLMLLSWISLSYVSQNMQYGSARDFYRMVVRQIENSDFDSSVLADCRKKAESRGYQLKIEQYKDMRDARVTLQYVYTFPVTQQKRKYVIDGYAR